VADDLIMALERELSEPTGQDTEFAGGLSGRILVLGASGKMGPTMSLLIRRAIAASGSRAEVIAVGRFRQQELRERMTRHGVDTVAADLLDAGQLESLPDAETVILMAGQKFGSDQDPGSTWMTNVVLPSLVLGRYAGSRALVFSTGNVYPLVAVSGPGSRESDRPEPVGEYAQSALARERVVGYHGSASGNRSAIIRLNYAVEPRYGVLRDVADSVWQGVPIDLSMGFVNVIWQRDAISMAFRALALAQSPPLVMNVTGLEKVSIRRLAESLGRRWDKKPQFENTEADTALLADATIAAEMLGSPLTSLETMVDRVARWVESGGASLGKPTHFQERGGRF